MRLRFFTVSAAAPTEDEATLNRFLAAHRVVSLDRHFVDAGAHSFWSIVVTHLPTAAAPSAERPRGPRVDYREVLSPTDFRLFARLRDLRKTLAERDAIPAYSVLTNAQMADIVTRRVRDMTGLAAIEGVGEARAHKYGPAVLEILQAMPPEDAGDAGA